MPKDIRERVVKSVAPPDPELWARTPIGGLNNLTPLEAIAGAGGQATLSAYLEDVESLERSWTTPSAKASQQQPDSSRVVRTFHCGLGLYDAAGWVGFPFSADGPRWIIPPLVRGVLTEDQIRVGPATVPFLVLVAIGLADAATISWFGLIWAAVWCVAWLGIPRRTFRRQDLAAHGDSVRIGVPSIVLRELTGEPRLEIWGPGLSWLRRAVANDAVLRPQLRPGSR